MRRKFCVGMRESWSGSGIGTERSLGRGSGRASRDASGCKVPRSCGLSKRQQLGFLKYLRLRLRVWYWHFSMVVQVFFLGWDCLVRVVLGSCSPRECSFGSASRPLFLGSRFGELQGIAIHGG